MNCIPGDNDYYDAPEQCSNNWRTCPCMDCEAKRDRRQDYMHDRQRDKDSENE